LHMIFRIIITLQRSLEKGYLYTDNESITPVILIF
jgi:hypothetical protein